MNQTIHETPDIESSSDAYAARFAGPSGQWMLEVQEKLTLRLLKDQGCSTILDVGGGHGQLARPLCREGYDVTVLGSDASCEHRIRDLTAKGACHFQTGPLTQLPFGDRTFDAVVCFRIVTHSTAWPTLIAELCRVARRAVIVDYPTIESVNRIADHFFTFKKGYEKNTRTWQNFRHADIRAAFERAGWTVQARSGQFLLPMALHRILKCRPLSAGLEGISRALGLNDRWGSPVILRARPQ